MRTRSWLSVFVGALGAASLASPFFTSMARAQASGELDAEAGSGHQAAEASEGTARSAAADMLTNHLMLHGDVGVAFPAGSVASGLPFSDVSGPGLTLGGGLGLGLSRYVSLDAGVSYAMLSAPELCAACTGTSFDVGLGLTYHLAQGFAIDPWLSFGVGYRTATLTSVTIAPEKAVADATFEGLDLARIGLGGSFFPLPWAGIGPYLQLAVGTTIARPDPELTPAVYTVFHMGVRIELDLMGRRSTPPTIGAAARRVNEPKRPQNQADLQRSEGGGPLWGGL